MSKRYHIELTFKTPNGPEVFARFYAGNSHGTAVAIFNKLKGSWEVDEHKLIFLNFVETHKGLPINLDTISCTLEDVGQNCKIITRELFKLHCMLPEFKMQAR